MKLLRKLFNFLADFRRVHKFFVSKNVHAVVGSTGNLILSPSWMKLAQIFIHTELYVRIYLVNGKGYSVAIERSDFLDDQSFEISRHSFFGWEWFTVELGSSSCRFDDAFKNFVYTDDCRLVSLKVGQHLSNTVYILKGRPINAHGTVDQFLSACQTE